MVGQSVGQLLSRWIAAVTCTMLQRQKQLSHLEKELTDAAVEDNRKLRLRLVSVSLQTVNIIGLCVSPIVFHATLSEWWWQQWIMHTVVYLLFSDTLTPGIVILSLLAVPCQCSELSMLLLLVCSILLDSWVWTLHLCDWFAMHLLHIWTIINNCFFLRSIR